MWTLCYASQIPTAVKDLPQLLRVLLAESPQLSAPSGTALAEAGCVTLYPMAQMQ